MPDYHKGGILKKCQPIRLVLYEYGGRFVPGRRQKWSSFWMNWREAYYNYAKDGPNFTANWIVVPQALWGAYFWYYAGTVPAEAR